MNETAPPRQAFKRRVTLKVCPILHPSIFNMLEKVDQDLAAAQLLTMAELFAQSQNRALYSVAHGAALAVPIADPTQQAAIAHPYSPPLRPHSLGLSLEMLESITRLDDWSNRERS